MPSSAGASAGGWPSAYWCLTAVAVAAVLSIPFFLIDVPPVLDYPNHLARYFVLAHPDDPILSQMFEPRWKILPNVGMDVIGAALLKITDVHMGGRILLACSLFAPLVGVVTYSRVVFGRFMYWPLASGVIAYNGIFFLGFLNFLLSLGLAFVGAALWIASRRNSRIWATALGALMAAAIFFCHILGVGLFALLIGSWESARLLDLRRRKTLAVREVVQTSAMIGLALSSSLMLYLVCPLADSATAPGSWKGFEKIAALFAPFMGYDANITVLIGIFFFSFLVLTWRNMRLAPGTLLVLVVLGLLFVAVPSTIKSGTFVNPRITLMIALMLFAGVQLQLTPRLGICVGVLFAAVIGFRAGRVAVDWIGHQPDLADLRAAIANVKPGSRVLVARGHPGNFVDVQVPTRALPGMYRVDGHLAALLVIERRAFWPLMFASPTQQPLAVKPPYNRIAQLLGEPVDWPVLREDHFSAEALARARYLQDWRMNFDEVLLIDPPETIDAPRGLVPAYRGDFAILYHIEPQMR